MKRACGFSLIELVIVVVIIAIIAAIAIPRLSRAASGARDASLRAQLLLLREAVELYAAEHDGLPGMDEDGAKMWRQLRKLTDIDGNIGTTSGVHIYGPYMRSRQKIPVGPNRGASGFHFSSTSPPEIDESRTKRAWSYNNVTGELVANTDDLDDSGVAYNTY